MNDVVVSHTINPFDPNKYRVPQDYSSVGVQKMLTIDVNKPKKSWFFRVHPDVSFRADFTVIEDEETRSVYLADPSLTLDLGSIVTHKTVYTCVNRQGNYFLWPVKLPDSQGRLDRWNETAREAAELGTSRWISVRAGDGRYDVYYASADLGEPQWDALPSFVKVVETAFKGKIIDDSNHPIVRRLRGEG
jgi:hypothetical protein